MIQEGKMMYFMDAMLPDLSDTLKIGFTVKQLEFCKKNEALMWTFLAEHKLLFSTDRMSIKRFMDDGPYTSAFTDESPGLAPCPRWCGAGRRIVDAVADASYRRRCTQQRTDPPERAFQQQKSSTTTTAL